MTIYVIDGSGERFNYYEWFDPSNKYSWGRIEEHFGGETKPITINVLDRTGEYYCKTCGSETVTELYSCEECRGDE